MLSTYAGTPLNSSVVTNCISLITLCSLGGFFAGTGSSALTGSVGSGSALLVLQSRDEHTQVIVRIKPHTTLFFKIGEGGEQHYNCVTYPGLIIS